jgi:hypothetical protein
MKSVSFEGVGIGDWRRKANMLNSEAEIKTAPSDLKSSGFTSMPMPLAVANAICALPALAAPCTIPPTRPDPQILHFLLILIDPGKAISEPV